jgi:magnesium-transporting ATPase (P-type)
VWACGARNGPFRRVPARAVLSLALCHTVVVDKKQDGTLDYQAESPDEKALVDGAAAVGRKVISPQVALLYTDHPE